MLNTRDDKLIETTVESRNIFNGQFLRLMNDTVRLPDGDLATREWIKFGRASGIIAITDNNEIILERQYRHPVKQIMIEIPAGKTEKNEEALVSAKREFLEETGYCANSWTELGTCFPCIGYSNETITYFLAKELTLGQQKLDKGEFLEIFTLPFSRALELIYNNTITDSKTITGIMLYLGYLNNIGKLD